jgi:hypothetical protein
LKLTVIPVGAPVAVNETLPAKPPVRVNVRVVAVFCAPCWIVSVDPLKPMVNPPAVAAVTVNVRVAARSATPGPVARTVNVEFPAVAAAAALMVIVLEVEPAAIVDGLAEAVTFAGSPSTLSVIGPAKLPVRPTVTETVLFPP